MEQEFYFKQEKPYTCGAASTRMVLSSLGINKSEMEVENELRTNNIRGTWTYSFAKLLKKYNLTFVEKSNFNINELKKLLEDGYKIIVCFFTEDTKEDHYSVVKKIDDKDIYFLDPFFGPEHKLSLEYFDKVWHSDHRFEDVKKWLIAVKK
jgi:predicted double-glycine peptidase